MEGWKQRDPIARFTAWAVSTGALHESDIGEIESEVASQIEAAVAFAEAGTFEPVGDLTRHVYGEGDPS